MTIYVNLEDAKDFFSWIDGEVEKILSEPFWRRPHLVDWNHRSVIISFDRDYKPFIGFTKGFNHPKNRNHYLPEPTPLLVKKVKIALDSQRKWGVGGPPGGRVFVGVDSICIRDSKNANKIKLADLIWADGGELLIEYLEEWSILW